MEQKQLSALQQHSEGLAQFIIKMSRFFEGFAPELDAELQTLRGHLSGKPDFTLAANSINKLNKHFATTDKTVKKYTQNAVRQLERTVKALQRTLIEDNDSRQQFSKLMVTLHQPVPSIFALQQLCDNVIVLLSNALTQEEAPEEAEPTPAEDSSPLPEHALYNEILSELLQLVDTYAQKNPDDSQLQLIKDKLQSEMSQDALLQSCIDILRLIVKESLTEATMTGKVIQSLHNSLGTISSDVTQSIEQSQSSFAARQQSQKEIREQLDSMEDALEHSDSVEKLKADAQHHLHALAKQINAQEEADSAEQSALIDLLQTMQNRLEHLQKQTFIYKKKLAEQIVSSQTDSLTRLPNRQAYNERLQREWAKATQNGTSLAIALVDIDHFKSINDRFGHAAGDKTLQVVARQLRSQCKEDAFIARWGGEEFVLLLPGFTPTELTERLDQLRKSLANLPFKFRQEKVTITASLGGTSLREKEAPHSMFERADKLLYQAKRSGRNCVITDQDTTE